MGGEGSAFVPGDWLIITFGNNEIKEAEILAVYPSQDNHGDEISFKNTAFFLKYDGQVGQWKAWCRNFSRGHVSIKKKQNSIVK